MAALSSYVWCTYRKGFTAIEPTMLTSDSGWGCMLRCGQMMLANVLLRHLLGDGFLSDGTCWEMRMALDGEHQGDSDVDQDALDTYLMVLSWFADRWAEDVPYSIHNVAQTGAGYGVRVGEWFGPTTAALVLRDLVALHGPELAVYVAVDGTVSKDRVALAATGMDASEGSSRTADVGAGEWEAVGKPVVTPFFSAIEPGEWRPTLLLVPLRLGLDRVHRAYVEQLVRIFSFPQSVGVMGGRPRSAYFFVGCQNQDFLYLDPHHTQQVADVAVERDTSSYHCDRLRRISVNKIDPSMALGFYVRSPEELEDLYTRIQVMLADEQYAATPLFSLVDEFVDYEAVCAAMTMSDDCSSDDGFELL